MVGRTVTSVLSFFFFCVSFFFFFFFFFFRVTIDKLIRRPLHLFLVKGKTRDAFQLLVR